MVDSISLLLAPVGKIIKVAKGLISWDD